jgi:hypothetical protein
MDVPNKRTNKMLREAISRAQQALKGGEMNLTLRAGETMLKGGNFVGIKSKDIIILLVDANSNGHFFDAKDRIIVSASGTTAMLDHKCKIISISKDVALAEKVKHASKMMGTGQSGVPEEIVNAVKLKELAKILGQLIAAMEKPVSA